MREVLFYSIILSRLDRSSASKRYMVYIAVLGLVNGFLSFGEIIARKSLHASPLMIALLVMSQPVAALTSIWWVKMIEGRDQRKLLLTVGLVGYVLMISGAFMFRMEHLLAVHFVFNLAYALIGPSENRILQQHVAAERTGRTFGMATSVRMGIAALATAAAGFWLEHVEGGWRQLYPAAALVGVLTLIILSSIRTAGGAPDRHPSLRQVAWTPLTDVINLLKERKDYLRFEIGFMCYGIAFMMALPVVPLYLVDALNLDYDTIGLSRGLVAQVVMIGAIPLFGRIFDRSTPHRMAVAVYLLLALYPILLASASLVDGSAKLWLVYLSFGWFGFTMSGITVIWQLSSIRFAGGKDAGTFQSVHVAATGIRGMFAPLVGYGIMSLFGMRAALLASAGMFLVAGVVMTLMRWIDRRRGEFRPLRVAA